MPRPTVTGVVRRIRGWLSLGYVRVAMQMGACTLLVMIISSPYRVWNGLSLDPVVANPAMVLLLCYLNILFSVGAGLAALQVAAETITGNCLGAGIGIGISYAAFGINGASRSNSPARSLPTLFFSGAIVLVHTIMRFRFRRYNQFWMQSIMGIALTIAVAYHAPYALWKFGVHWMWYALMASAALLVVMSTVFPQYAGSAVRSSLATGLRTLGVAMESGLLLMTGELDPETGLLAACTGETEGRVGVDSGLWHGGLEKLYTNVYASGTAIAAVWKWEAAARLEFDLYRRQHVFPAESFNVLTLTLRSMLSSFMMVIYPLQTGRQECRAVHAHAATLRVLGGAMRACCDGLANVLLGAKRLRDAMPDLIALEQRFDTLLTEVAPTLQGNINNNALSTNVLAFRLLIATLHTLCTRLCQMHLSMAEALGRDDPEAQDVLAEHLGLGARRQSKVWGLVPQHQQQQQLARLNSSPLATVSRAPMSFLRESILTTAARSVFPSAKRRRPSLLPAGTPSSLLAYLEAQTPVLKVLPVEETQPNVLDRVFEWIRRRTGITKNHLAVGLQGMVGYLVIMIMVIVPQVNNSFDHRMLWGLLIVITILEQVSGQVVLKGVQRLVGTALGAGLGVGSMYFVYLCNGLTYDTSHIQKFIIMPIALAVCAAMVGGSAIYFGRWFYCFLIASIIMAVVALPNYHEEYPLPKTAIWRLAATAVGVGVNIILAACLFPVTAQAVYKSLMVGVLEELADVLERTMHSLVPREHRRNKKGRRPGAIPQVSTGTTTVTRLGGGGVLRTAEHHRSSVDDEGQVDEDAGGALGSGSPLSSLRSQDGSFVGAHARRLSTTVDDALKNQGDSINNSSQAVETMLHEESSIPSGNENSSPIDAADNAESQSGPLSHQVSLPAHGRRRFVDTAPGLPTTLTSATGLNQTPPINNNMTSPSAAASSETRRTWRKGFWPRQPPSTATQTSTQEEHATQTLAAPSLLFSKRAHSIYVSVEGAGAFKLVGGTYLRTQPRLKQIGMNIAAMTALDQALHYEYYPFSKVKRFPFTQAQRAQRLCRQMVNIAGSFSAALDAHDTYSCPLLIPVATELGDVSAQLRACLLALAGIVKGTVRVTRAVDMVVNLEDLTHHLFLSVIARSSALSDSGPDAVLCVTFLAMLFNAAYVVRLLCIALTNAFVPGDAEAQSAVKALADSARWALDEQVMVLCNDLMATALYEEESGEADVLLSLSTNQPPDENDDAAAATAKNSDWSPFDRPKESTTTFSGQQHTSPQNHRPQPPSTLSSMQSWESELAALSRASRHPAGMDTLPEEEN